MSVFQCFVSLKDFSFYQDFSRLCPLLFTRSCPSPADEKGVGRKFFFFCVINPIKAMTLSIPMTSLIKVTDRSLTRFWANHSESLCVQTTLHQRKSRLLKLFFVKVWDIISFLNFEVRGCDEICQRRLHCGRARGERRAGVTSFLLAAASGGRTTRARIPSSLQLLPVGEIQFMKPEKYY